MPSQEEITAAVQNLRGIEGPTFHGLDGKRHVSEREYCAAVTLAMAYLAEHPADDDEAVTEEWLRAVGFETHSARLCLGARLQFTHCGGWNAWWAIDGLMHASSRLVDGLNTRGHVRRLCQCLGIALTETP